MRIKKIVSQHRRDMTIIYQCEHCGAEREGFGYDDANFHRNVIPKMVCGECQREGEESYRPLATKYPEGEVI